MNKTDWKLMTAGRKIIHPSTFIRDSSSAGFTLVEVVLAVVILSLVALILGSALNLGINARAKGESEAVEIQKLRVLSGLISEQVKSIYPYKMEIDDEEKVIFEGETDSIIFVTVSNDRNYRGFKWIRYKFREGVLLYNEGRLPDKKLFEKVMDDEEVVDSEIHEIKFSYYSSATDEWKESWSIDDGLPGAIMVRIGYFEPMLITLPLMKISDEGISRNEII